MKQKLSRIAISLVLFFAAFPVRNTLISALVFACSALYCGYKVFIKAGRNIINGNVFDENLLMSVACIGAFIIGQYAEGCAVLILFCIGEMLESYAVGKSRKSIAELMDMRPDTANLVTESGISEVSPEDVPVGSVIEVRSGERVPLDGIIIAGESELDTSSLTGESEPVFVSEGDKILSGSIVSGGVLQIRTESEFETSTVSRILELVENASEKKTKTESFISRFSAIYTPCVVIAALLLAVIPSIITKDVRTWGYRALDFLVVSCPCALVISVPLSYFGGIGKASKRGILIKGSGGIEALSRISVAVFDKTGTLTEGRFSVADIVCKNISETELLYYAASCESVSSHPIAKCIAAGAEKIAVPADVKEIAGQGITAMIDGHLVKAGNEKFVVPDEKADGTAVYLSVDGRFAGYICVEDTPKENAPDAIRALKKLGVTKNVMLSGDKQKTAEHTAKLVGIDEVHAQLLPQEKVTALEKIMEENADGTVLYAGDGINDAPVIARADVGIAMGGLGADCSVEAADAVIMTDDITKIPEAAAIARRTVRIVRENIVFSIAVKIIILVLCAFGFAGMWAAVFGDVGVTVIAIFNALRAMDNR